MLKKREETPLQIVEKNYGEVEQGRANKYSLYSQLLFEIVRSVRIELKEAHA